MVVPLRFSAVDVSGRTSFYRESPPPAGLSGAIRCTWEGVPGWTRALRLLPDGCVDLAWDGQRLMVVSAGAGPVWFGLSGAGSSVGVRLQCGAAGGLLGPEFATTGASVLDLRDLFPRARIADDLHAALTPAVRRAVLTRFVARRLRDGFQPDPVMLAATRALAAPGARTDVVADQLGVSVRTLRRRVHEAVGCGPKALHRVLRFHRFLRHLGDLAAERTTLSSVAAGLGFADQSHLGHECLRLSGSSPTQLVSGYARHAGVAETDQTAAP